MVDLSIAMLEQPEGIIPLIIQWQYMAIYDDITYDIYIYIYIYIFMFMIIMVIYGNKL